MKRFYCTICKKVKRVRNLPLNTHDRMNPDATKRIGECNRHSEIVNHLINRQIRMKVGR